MRWIALVFCTSVALFEAVHAQVPAPPRQRAAAARTEAAAALPVRRVVLYKNGIGYFEHLRKLTATPIAMGELFNSRHEWMDLVSRRLIDFIRVHISQVGGLTPARKMAAMCELFAVRTAWHGPGDVSPVGHAANVHLDLAVPNFGIQEAREFTQAEQVFTSPARAPRSRSASHRHDSLSSQTASGSLSVSCRRT